MMVKQYIRDFTEAARAAGISRLNFYLEEKQSRSVSVYRGELEQLEHEEQKLLFIEGEVDGFSGAVFVENFQPELMEEHIRRIRESARWGKRPFTPYALEAAAEEPAEDGQDFPLSEAVERLRAAEQAACRCDSRIEQVQDCRLTEIRRTITLADGDGRCAADRDGSGNFYISLVARDGACVQPGGRGTFFPLHEIPDMEGLARLAAGDALSGLNAASYPTGASPVVLDCRVVCELLDAFLPAFFAKNVQNRVSVLTGRLGQPVAGENITILEDPTLEGGLCRRRFDDEGVPTQVKEIVSGGVLRAYLYNRQSAAADGCTSGGNGFKPSFSEDVSTGYTNVILCPGACTRQELLEKMGNGLLITGVSGVFAGAHAASGDFSLISRGYRVRDGRRCEAVNQITIAGNFFEMLQRVLGIGRDEKWMQTPAGCVRTPSLYVSALAISGGESPS